MLRGAQRRGAAAREVQLRELLLRGAEAALQEGAGVLLSEAAPRAPPSSPTCAVDSAWLSSRTCARRMWHSERSSEDPPGALDRGLVAAAKLAVLQDAPLVVFTASGGARMQEGAVSLMQMPRSTIAALMLKDAKLPFLVVLTDPTTGGVTASFAMLGDIHISEPGAMIGFAGARVIEQTVRETLPEGFQRAEYLLAHGIVDMVVPRAELPATLGRIISLLHPTPVAEAPVPEPEQVAA